MPWLRLGPVPRHRPWWETQKHRLPDNTMPSCDTGYAQQQTQSDRVRVPRFLHVVPFLDGLRRQTLPRTCQFPALQADEPLPADTANPSADQCLPQTRMLAAYPEVLDHLDSNREFSDRPPDTGE